MQTAKVVPKTAPASKSAEPHNLYRGTNKAGVHKLEIAGHLFDGYGELRRSKSEQASKGFLIKPADGVPKNYVVVFCIGAKTGNLYRFAGTLLAQKKRAHVEQRRTGTATAASQPTTPKPTPALIPKKTASASQASGKHLAIAKEMQRIREAKEAGLDPNVRMEFVERFLNISRATLYRRMDALQFPKPIKHGHINFWPLSVIEQFASGQWAAQLAQTSQSVSQ